MSEQFTEVEHLRSDLAHLTEVLATFANTGRLAQRGFFKDRNPEFTVMSCLKALDAVKRHGFSKPPETDDEDPWLTWHGSLTRFTSGDLTLAEVGYRHYDLVENAYAEQAADEAQAAMLAEAIADLDPIHAIVLAVMLDGDSIRDKGGAFYASQVLKKMVLRNAGGWKLGAVVDALAKLQEREMVMLADDSGRHMLTSKGLRFWELSELSPVQTIDSAMDEERRREASRKQASPLPTLTDFDRTVLKVLAESKLPTLTEGGLFQRLHILTGTAPRSSAISAALVALMASELVQESKGVPHTTAYTATTNGRQFNRDFPIVVTKEVGPQEGPPAGLAQWFPDKPIGELTTHEARDILDTFNVVPYEANAHDSAVGDFMLHSPLTKVLGEVAQTILLYVRDRARSRMDLYYKLNEGELTMPGQVDAALNELVEVGFIRHFREMFWGTPNGRAWLKENHKHGVDHWFKEPVPPLTHNEELALSVIDDLIERLRRVDHGMTVRGLVGLRIDLMEADSARRHFLESRENLVS